jgi:hypothetical protein
MKAVVGIFTTSDAAVRAASELRAVGITSDRINLLTPAASTRDLDAVPTTEAEQPGVGPAIGAVVGGAAGAAGGVHVAAIAASTLVPGVGPILATGLIAGALLGGGAGAVAGRAIEDSLTDGVPRDELYVYEDALRRGRTVLVAQVDDDRDAETARATLTRSGAETVDAAREAWWVGLRDAEAARYADAGGDFARDEATYRLGFEAALSRHLRGKADEEIRQLLSERHPRVYEEAAFRRGYEAGQAYHRSRQE